MMKKEIIISLFSLLLISNLGFSNQLSVEANNIETRITLAETVCGKTYTLVAATTPTSGQTGQWTASCDFSAIEGSSQNSQTMKVIADNYGTCTFTWQVKNADDNSVVASEEFEIKFIQIPQPSAGVNTSICGNLIDLNGTASLTNSNIFWSSENDAVTFSPNDQINTNVKANSYGTHSILLTETKEGCVGTSTINIAFIKKPSPSIEIPEDVACGSSYNLKVATDANANGEWTAYEVNASGEAVLMANQPGYSPNASSPDVTVTLASALTNNDLSKVIKFVWKEKNSSGATECEGSASKTITFAQKPVASIQPNKDIFEGCTNCVELFATPPANSAFTCEWKTNEDGTYSEGDKNSPNATYCVNPNAFKDGKGFFDMHWTVSNPAVESCNSSASVKVKIYQEPVANAGKKIDAVCGNDYDLKATYFIPNNNNYTPIGTWAVVTKPNANSVADFNNANTNETSVHVNQVGVWEFSFTESNSFLSSCKSSDIVKIEFIEKPVVNAGKDLEACGLSIKLDGISGGNAGSWADISGSTFADKSDPKTEVTSINEGTIKYTWVETVSSTLTDLSCGGSDDVNVTFWNKPTATVDFTADLKDSVCGLLYNNTLSFNQMQLMGNAPSSTQKGFWYATGEGGSGIVYGNVNSNNTNVTVPEYKTYQFMWVIKTASTSPNFECSDEAGPIAVKFKKSPIANAGVDKKFCALEGNLEAIPTPNVGAIGIWTSPSSANITFEDQNSPKTKITSTVYNTEAEPNFKLNWTENNAGCSSTDEVNVSFSIAPSSEFVIIPPKCFGESAIIKAEDETLPQYDWHLPGGTIEKSLTNNLGAEHTKLVYWTDGKDEHEVGLTTTNIWECTSTLKKKFTEPEKPKYSTKIIKDTCELQKGGLEFVLEEGGKEFSFFWQNPDFGPPVGTSIPNGINNIPAGTYKIKASYQSYNTTNPVYKAEYIKHFGTDLCESFAEYTIPTMGVIKPKIEISSEIVLEDLTAPNAKVVFLNKTDYDGIKKRCIWKFGDGESDKKCDDLIEHIYTKAGCFYPELTIINKELPECNSSIKLEKCIRVKDNSELEIPNVFSPNGDGINDFFQVKTTSLRTFKGTILNRWGSVVYSWENWQDASAGWDGKFKGGTEASAGVYYFVIEAEGLDGEKYNEKGPLHLMK